MTKSGLATFRRKNAVSKTAASGAANDEAKKPPAVRLAAPEHLPGLVGALIGGNIGTPPMLLGLIAGAFAGGLKELYDALREEGTVDLMDAVYTLVGSVPTAGLVAVVV